MSISINKTNTPITLDGENQKLSITNEMSESMNGICRELLIQNNEFIEKNVFESLCDYISKYDRVLYAPISNMIYDIYEKHDDPAEIDRIIGNMMSNVDALREYAYHATQEGISKDAKKVVIKIWDHINLANQQYKTLKESEEEYKDRFNRSIAPIKENITKDMSAQLLSIVGIFTALAFLIFGGITSLDNIFSNETLPLLKMVIIGCVWGMCILNVVFVFLFCVGKMTNLNFKSTNKAHASIFKKYPIVWWSNFIAMAILIVASWLYYFSAKADETKIGEIIRAYPTIALVVITIFISILLIIAAYKLVKETKYSEEDNNCKE